MTIFEKLFFKIIGVKIPDFSNEIPEEIPEKKEERKPVQIESEIKRDEIYDYIYSHVNSKLPEKIENFISFRIKGKILSDTGDKINYDFIVPFSKTGNDREKIITYCMSCIFRALKTADKKKDKIK